MSTSYRERLWPGPLGWLLLAGGAGAAALVAQPLGAVGMTIAAGVAAAALVAGVWLTSATVAVVDGRLVAGQAQIPVHLLGEPAVLDRPSVLGAVGPGSDARDYVLLRSWLPGGVSLPVLDPQDPTPRWVVSTRHADRLAEAIAQAQAAHSEQIG